MSGRFAVRVTALAFAAAFAFTTVAGLAGVNDPLSGVGVGLGKKPNPSAISRHVTSADGSVNFGVLPKGEYELTLTPPKGAPAAAQTGEVTITGAVAPVKASWNFETSRVREVALGGPDTAARMRTTGAADLNATGNDRIFFTADGKHRVVVVVSAQQSAVTRSRTDIKSNVQMYASPAPTPTPSK